MQVQLATGDVIFIEPEIVLDLEGLFSQLLIISEA